MKKFLAVVLSALLLGLVPANQAEAQSYKSCSALQKVYKHGVAASKNSKNKGLGPIHSPRVSAAIYKLNSRLDVDRDNIACEVRKPAINPSPSSKPNQGGAAPSPTPAEMVYEDPTVPSDAIELCRIQEASSVRAQLPAGFPQANPLTLTPRSGVVKWALIPIDFQDLPGEKGFRTRVDDQMRLLSEWFLNASGGRLKVEWVVLDDWATLPGKSTDYLIPNSVNVNDAANGPKLFRNAMAAADPLFDFTNIQTVNFLLPNGQTVIGESSQGFPWDSVVKDYSTTEGKIASYSIAGKFFDLPGKAYWSYWAHEFGHAIGLPHVGGGNGLPPFNPWDLMGGQDGPARELSGWLRFVADWLSDDQVYCRDVFSISSLGATLVPLSSSEKGIKFIVIPVSRTKALLIESRRQTKFSCTTVPTQDGVLVYEYDATQGHYQNFLIPVTPVGRGNLDSSCKFAPQPPDSILREGDKVTVSGLTIEIVKSGKFDKILISKG